MLKYYKAKADGTTIEKHNNDLKEIKSKIHNKLDHKNINEVLNFHPTAENLAKWICHEITNCYKVEVYETENNLAIYEID